VGSTGSTGPLGTGPTGNTGPTGTIPSSVADFTVTGTLNVTGITSVQELQETVNTVSAPASPQSFNWTTGSVFYVSSMSANFTANITNLPTTANRIYVITFILVQGVTPYFINALQVAGSSVSIRWSGGTAPTATGSRQEFETIALYYSGSAWTAYGQYSSYN
jgi:hypothetical protein